MEYAGRGRAALVSKSVTKGRHIVEFKIIHMSGTLFVGAMQATRRVWLEAQKTVLLEPGFCCLVRGRHK